MKKNIKTREGLPISKDAALETKESNLVIPIKESAEYQELESNPKVDLEAVIGDSLRNIESQVDEIRAAKDVAGLEESVEGFSAQHEDFAKKELTKMGLGQEQLASLGAMVSLDDIGFILENTYGSTYVMLLVAAIILFFPRKNER